MTFVGTNRCRKIEPNVQKAWRGWGRWPSASAFWDHADRKLTVATSIFGRGGHADHVAADMRTAIPKYVCGLVFVRVCACKCVSVCTCPCYRFIVKSGKKPFESLQKRVRRRAAAYRVRRYVIYQSVPVVGIAATAVYGFRRFYSTQGSTTPLTREPTHTSPTWQRV